MAERKFDLGTTVMTKAISDVINESAVFGLEVNKAFERYQNCDWSDMEFEEDKELNDRAVKNGSERIFATYNTSKGKIYIITEWDRSYTTILFPFDY